MVRSLEDRWGRPDQEGDPEGEHLLEATAHESGLALRVDGGAARRVASLAEAAEHLFQRMVELSQEPFADHTKLHAGCVDLDGGRALVVGPARAGKSTLMARLLLDGADVSCDDLVLLRDAEVLPFPRRLRLRASSLPLLPEVAARVPDAETGAVRLDPTDFGRAWRIVATPARTLFLLEPDHGGRSRLLPCSKIQAAELLMAQSNLPAGGARRWLREFQTVIAKASPYRLRCGDLGEAAALIRRASRSQD